MPRYDFECPEGHVTERRADITTDMIECPVCGLAAYRAPFSASTYLIGGDVPKPQHQHRFPSKEAATRYKTNLFKEASAEIAHSYGEAERNTGLKLKTPDYYHKGLRQAHERTGGKVVKRGEHAESV